MCFIIGQLIAAGVLNGLVDIPTEWSYRIPFGMIFPPSSKLYSNTIFQLYNGSGLHFSFPFYYLPPNRHGT